MAKARSVRRVAPLETVIHDYSGPERSQLVPSKRSTDHFRRPQIIHFDRTIRAGDHIVLGYEPFEAETFLVAANIRHPDKVKGVWWATLEPLDTPVTIAGATFSSPRRWLADRRGRRPAPL